MVCVKHVEDCDKWGVVIVSFGQNGTKRGLKCPQFGGVGGRFGAIRGYGAETRNFHSDFRRIKVG